MVGEVDRQGDSSRPTIAFLGTGLMGLPMCGHLIDAGYPVRIWNRTRDKALSLAERGGQICGSAEEAVRGADIVIVMLLSGPVIEEVLFGNDREGAPSPAESLIEGASVIVMSSIPVETARSEAQRLAERGVAYIDAPVSGGEQGAIDATLTIMAGGAEADLAGVRPVLDCLGNVTHVGPAGAGQLAKLANQTIVGITIAAVAEAMLLAEQGGADPEAVREALMGGFADSTILRQHGRRMIDGNFVPGGMATTQLKDMRTITALAADLGLELPTATLIEQLYEQMCERGLGELDHSGLYVEIAARNGLKRP
jgi:2-hydroxy-3-oxopropionate reductase